MNGSSILPTSTKFMKTVYCCQCKKHISGPKKDYNDKNVSHTYCPSCLKQELEKLDKK